MTPFIKSTLLGLILAITSLSTAVAKEGSLGLFHDMQGNPQALENFTGDGNWLVVMLWAANCHICNQEAGAYADFHKAKQNKGVRVLGITMDGEENKAAARAFIDRHQLPFPNLIAEPEVLGLYYASLTQESLRGTPTFLLFDDTGKLAAAQAGAVSTEAIERFISGRTTASR